MVDSVKKRVEKAERKKLLKISDESANLKSPNKAKLGLATQSAAQISQKSECSQKPRTKIEATDLNQSLMSFRKADHQTLSLGSPHGALDRDQNCCRNMS